MELRNEGKLPAAVIFDMDGVLADTEPLHAKCFVRAFAELGIDMTLEGYRQAVTLGGTTVRELFLSLGGTTQDWDRAKSIKDAALMEAIGDATLLPGVISLLHLLREAGILTAVATSARRKSLNIVIDHLGIRPYFDALVTKDEVDAEKPDPAIFLLAARKLGADPAECVVLEDSPRGVLAAARAGMKCIAIPTPSTADGDFSRATLVLKSLEDIGLDTLRDLS